MSVKKIKIHYQKTYIYILIFTCERIERTKRTDDPMKDLSIFVPPARRRNV